MADAWNRLQLFSSKKIQRRTMVQRALVAGVSLIGVETILQSCTTDAGLTGSSLNFANWASAETATRSNIDKALQAFESQNNVQVNNIGMPFDDVLNQLTSMTKAGIPPDVMELSGNWPYALGGTNALADLAPFVSQSWHKDAFPNSFEAGTYKGTLYAVPFSITPHGFWYNKKLMATAGLNPTPPRTIAELNQAMAALRAVLPADAYPIGIDTSKTDYALIGFWPWIWTFGGNPMVDDGKGNVTINWADNGTVAAFQWLQDAVKNRWTPNGQAIKAEREMMAFEKLVFKLDGPYLTGILGDTNPDVFGTVQKVNATWGVTTTPLGPGVSQPVTCADIHNLGMSALAKNKDLAWKLIDFLTTSRDVILSFLIPEGGVLPHMSFNTSQQLYAKYYSDAISRSFISNVIRTMRPPAFGIHYTPAALAVVTALQEIANGAQVRPRLLKLTDEVKAIYKS